MTRSWIAAAALACACALASGLAITWSSNSLLIAGSTPATVWSPALPVVSILAISLATVALVALAGRRLRPAALILWLAALAILTHRVVDGGPDGFKDVWLGVPVTTIRAYVETDPPPRDCRIALVPALCVTRGGRQRAFATLLKFRPAR